MKILIVEDDKIVRTALEFCLKKGKHQVSIATDGSDALKKIETEVPDLIITDIMMPYISGLELVKLVKKKYKDDIKIIVLSTLDEEDVVLEAFSEGVDDFLTKPFNPDELSLRLQRFNFLS